LSLYLQGTTSGLMSSVDELNGAGIEASLYPNPTTGTITVELSVAKAEITVTNMLGEVVLQQRTNQERTTLQLDEPGMYMVHMTTAAGTATRKLIVQK
ncbi:MAG TPA: T9SS type A sorting domain-containing protein, partial [Flavobacteriales bacterium]|nr:T9SS type A sorting domain-containing protein [Flavobacteriales bacterium]